MAVLMGGERRKDGLIGQGARYVLWVLDFEGLCIFSINNWSLCASVTAV